jgi:hypothetical protein
VVFIVVRAKRRGSVRHAFPDRGAAKPGGVEQSNPDSVFHKQAAHSSELHTKTPRCDYLYYITIIL